MRNQYSKEFEETMLELAPTTELDRLLWYAYSYFGYEINKNQLRQYLSKRNIHYKNYNKNKVRPVGDKLPIGSERIKSDGMTQIKISKNKWEYKQRYIYEQYHNVKLKSDDYVIFLDHDRTNFNINNLIKISRHESSILANEKLFSKDPKITETGIIIAKLIIKIKESKGE